MRSAFLISSFLILSFVFIQSCSSEEDDTTIPNVVQAAIEESTVQYTLTVLASEGGTVSTEGGTYDEGTEVTITATPNEGYRFDGWDGIESNENSLIIIVDSNIEISPIFSLVSQTQMSYGDYD